MSSKTLTIFCASLVLIHLQCTTTKNVKHKHHWRFNDPYINQTIISGWEHINKRHYEWAMLDFTRLIQKNYIDYDILFGAGLAYYYMNDITRAIDYCTGAIEQNPQHFEAYFYRAQCYLALNNTKKALDDLHTIAAMQLNQPFICGYYIDNDDLADDAALQDRKKEVQKIIVAIVHD